MNNYIFGTFFLQPLLTVVEKEKIVKELKRAERSNDWFLATIKKYPAIKFEIFIGRCRRTIQGNGLYFVELDDKTSISSVSCPKNIQNMRLLAISSEAYSFYKSLSVCVSSSENLYSDFFIEMVFFLLKHINFYKRTFPDEYSKSKSEIGKGIFSKIVGAVVCEMLQINVLIVLLSNGNITVYRPSSKTEVTVCIGKCDHNEQYFPMVPIKNISTSHYVFSAITEIQVTDFQGRLNNRLVQCDEMSEMIIRCMHEEGSMHQMDLLLRPLYPSIRNAILRLRQFTSQQYFRSDRQKIHSASLKQMILFTTGFVPVESNKLECVLELQPSIYHRSSISLANALSTVIMGTNLFSPSIWLSFITASVDIEWRDKIMNEKFRIIPFADMLKHIAEVTVLLERKIFVYRVMANENRIRRTIFHHCSKFSPLRLFYNFGKFYAILPILNSNSSINYLSKLFCYNDCDECWTITSIPDGRTDVSSNEEFQQPVANYLPGNKQIYSLNRYDVGEYARYIDESLFHIVRSQPTPFTLQPRIHTANKSFGIRSMSTDTASSVLSRNDTYCLVDMSDESTLQNFLKMLGSEQEIQTTLCKLNTICVEAIERITETQPYHHYRLALEMLHDTFKDDCKMECARDMLIYTPVQRCWINEFLSCPTEDKLLNQSSSKAVNSTPERFRVISVTDDSSSLLKSISILIFKTDRYFMHLQLLIAYTFVAFNQPYLQLKRLKNVDKERMIMLLNGFNYLTKAHSSSPQAIDEKVKKQALMMTGHMLRRNVFLFSKQKVASGVTLQRCMFGLQNEGSKISKLFLLWQDNHFLAVLGPPNIPSFDLTCLKETNGHEFLLAVNQWNSYSVEKRYISYRDQNVFTYRKTEVEDSSKPTAKKKSKRKPLTEDEKRVEETIKLLGLFQSSSYVEIIAADHKLRDNPKQLFVILPIHRTDLAGERFEDILQQSKKTVVEIKFNYFEGLTVLDCISNIRSDQMENDIDIVKENEFMWSLKSIWESEEMKILKEMDKKLSGSAQQFQQMTALDVSDPFWCQSTYDTQLQQSIYAEAKTCQTLTFYKKNSIIGGCCGFLLSNIEWCNLGPSRIILLIVPHSMYDKLQAALNSNLSIERKREMKWKNCDLMIKQRVYFSRVELDRLGIAYKIKTLAPNYMMITSSGSYVQGVAVGNSLVFKRNVVMGDFGFMRDTLNVHMPICDCIHHQTNRDTALSLSAAVLHKGAIVTSPPSLSTAKNYYNSVVNCQRSDALPLVDNLGIILDESGTNDNLPSQTFPAKITETSDCGSDNSSNVSFSRLQSKTSRTGSIKSVTGKQSPSTSSQLPTMDEGNEVRGAPTIPVESNLPYATGSSGKPTKEQRSVHSTSSKKLSSTGSRKSLIGHKDKSSSSKLPSNLTSVDEENEVGGALDVPVEVSLASNTVTEEPFHRKEISSAALNATGELAGDNEYEATGTLNLISKDASSHNTHHGDGTRTAENNQQGKSDSDHGDTEDDDDDMQGGNRIIKQQSANTIPSDNQEADERRRSPRIMKQYAQLPIESESDNTAKNLECTEKKNRKQPRNKEKICTTNQQPLNLALHAHKADTQDERKMKESYDKNAKSNKNDDDDYSASGGDSDDDQVDRKGSKCIKPKPIASLPPLSVPQVSFRRRSPRIQEQYTNIQKQNDEKLFTSGTDEDTIIRKRKHTKPMAPDKKQKRDVSMSSEKTSKNKRSASGNAPPKSRTKVIVPCEEHTGTTDEDEEEESFTRKHTKDSKFVDNKGMFARPVDITVSGIRSFRLDNPPTIDENFPYELIPPRITSANGRGRPRSFQKPIIGRIQKEEEYDPEGDSALNSDSSSESSFVVSGSSTPDSDNSALSAQLSNNESEDSDRPHKCTQEHPHSRLKGPCNKRFTKKETMIRHQNEENNPRRYPCLECINRIANANNISPGDAQDIVDHDGMLFGEKVAFKRSQESIGHAAMKHVKTRFLCEVCDDWYTSLDALRKHRKTLKHSRNLKRIADFKKKEKKKGKKEKKKDKHKGESDKIGHAKEAEDDVEKTIGKDERLDKNAAKSGQKKERGTGSKNKSGEKAMNSNNDREQRQINRANSTHETIESRQSAISMDYNDSEEDEEPIASSSAQAASRELLKGVKRRAKVIKKTVVDFCASLKKQKNSDGEKSDVNAKFAVEQNTRSIKRKAINSEDEASTGEDLKSSIPTYSAKGQLKKNENEKKLPSTSSSPKDIIEIDCSSTTSNHASDSNAVLGFVPSRNGPIDIFPSNLDCLDSESWLNDDVMNAFLNLLSENNSGNAIYVINSTVFLGMVGYSKLFDNLIRFTRQDELNEYRLIMIPVMVSSVHWALAVGDVSRRTVQYFDSLGGQNQTFMNIFQRFLNERISSTEETAWTVAPVDDYPQQEDTYNCGVYTLATAYFLSREMPIVLAADKMANFRAFIKLFIQSHLTKK